jgi:hypothetical protein
MTFLNRISLPLLALLLVMSFPLAASAQAPWLYFVGPNGLVNELVIGDCFDFYVGPNMANQAVDIKYTVDGGPEQEIDGWPTLDQYGRMENVCTSSGSYLGSITFTKVRVSGAGTFQDLPNPYTVTNLPQATGGSYSPGNGFAGNSSFTFHVDGVAGRPVRIRYGYGGGAVETVIQVDGSGDYNPGVLDHYTYQGPYNVMLIQDAAAQSGNWTSMNAEYVVLPPQPTSLSLAPTSLTAGGANGSNMFRMSAGNGAEVSLDYKYQINGVAKPPDRGWPYLYPINGGPDGRSEEIFVSRCAPGGERTFTAVQNTLNGPDSWVDLDPPVSVTVQGAGLPSLAAISPAGALLGQKVTVTITGQNLCGVELSTNYLGLTFEKIENGDWTDGTSMTADFKVAANAVPGNAVVTLKTRGWQQQPARILTFIFGINQVGALPTITSISPANSLPGSTTTVTMTGTNLFGARLSTTWGLLTFSDVTPNGTSLTAKFLIGAAAQLGNPVIEVKTAAGSVTTSLFTIGAPPPGLSREYIYLGDRVIAVDSP